MNKRDRIGFWILMSLVFGILIGTTLSGPTMAFRNISEVEEMRFNTFYTQLKYFDENYITYMVRLRERIELLQWQVESLRVLCTER